MKKNHSSTDGFIPRRFSNQPARLHTGNKVETSISVFDDKTNDSKKATENMRILGQPKPGFNIVNSDIDESLRGIDDIDQPLKKLSRRQLKKLKKQDSKKRRSLPKRIIKWVLILLLLAVLSVGGYTAYKFINAGQNVFQGSILDIFKNQPLKQDSSGRSNFLILGTSEDDPGHEGALLTDSMLVVSINQTDKSMYMFSVPRDLYVKYGDGCSIGTAGKINAYYDNCINAGKTSADEQERLAKTQKLVGDIFGLDIQYGVHVDHTVIKQAVDAVGGIDVDIEGSNGAPGVFDRSLDWHCNYTCYLVKYDNGVHHLDGAHALYLSMARGDTAPTYGLGNSNFDREVNQQKILVALKNKAMSTGTLTNLGAITKLVDAFGNNLRSNIQTSEIRTITQVASEIKTSNIHSIIFIGDNAVMTTDNIDGASVVVPSAGTFDYSGIRALLAKNLSSDPVVREAAPIVVLNGTDTAGLGQTEANKLTDAGYNVTLVSNAPDTTYTKTEVYQIGTGNAGTAEKLAGLFNTTIKKTDPPVAVTGDVKFVVVVGANAS